MILIVQIVSYVKSICVKFLKKLCDYLKLFNFFFIYIMCAMS